MSLFYNKAIYIRLWSFITTYVYSYSVNIRTSQSCVDVKTRQITRVNTSRLSTREIDQSLAILISRYEKPLRSNSSNCCWRTVTQIKQKTTLIAFISDKLVIRLMLGFDKCSKNVMFIRRPLTFIKRTFKEEVT